MKIFPKKPMLLIAMMLAGGMPPAIAAVAHPQVVDVTLEDRALAIKLANQIRSDVAVQPRTASVEDLEGIIVFALSRVACKPKVINMALDIVQNDPKATNSLRKAVENVRRATARCKLKRGTGAVGGNNFSGFSSPSFAGGGGSSNYSH